MNREELRKSKIESFNPNGVGLKNGHFIGLPFDEHEAEVVVVSVPWDVTVSFAAGTSKGPENILSESGQLDLEDSLSPNAWHRGLFVRPPDEIWKSTSAKLREQSSEYIRALENGLDPKAFNNALASINEACAELVDYVYMQSNALFKNGQIPGVLGGDHSSPYGLIKSAIEHYPNLGILQIDAHMDLRKAYEGFAWSHASIFYNVMEHLPVNHLVQMGIRDYCEEEWLYAQKHVDKIDVYRDSDIRKAQYSGKSFKDIVEQAINFLPEFVHISVDIDGLDPSLCPGTGTPVPGGFSFQEVIFILEQVKLSGRKIVSFDLCEVGGEDPWDANVGARILYKLANLAG